jgi:hypothetical protein
MTDVTLVRRPPPVVERLETARQGRTIEWVRLHRTSLLVGLPLLVVVGVVHAFGMASSPTIVDDEGTYVAQAWAVQNWGTLAHYTYWYDHPPLGWVQIAGWTWLTQAFDRADLSVLAGREAMLVAKVVSAGLLYVLARRLQFTRFFAVLGVVLFALSPLAVEFQRSVYLDNVATPWLIGAFVLAASPRRHLGAAAGSAACFAIACLSKETTLILLPALALMLWQNNDLRTRRLTLAVAATLFGALILMYPLFALLRGELLPGDGHVSLLWSVDWQLFSRPSSGSVLDGSSAARNVVETWLRLDAVLMVAGAITVPFALWMRRLRPVGLALAIQLVMLLRDGYLPFPYVIAVAPFAALVVAGVSDRAWHLSANWRESNKVKFARGGLIAGAIACAVLVVPMWGRGLADQNSSNRAAPIRSAVAWLDANVPRDSTVVVEDSMWVDLVEKGFEAEDVIWFYKLDLDPAVALPNGWRDIDFIATGNLAPETLDSLPTNRDAIEHSNAVATFGEGPEQVVIRQVVK